MSTNITLGFSPCPNDTYMFAALVHGWIDTGDLNFHVRMADVESLNEWAGGDLLDVTKMSFHRSLGLEPKYSLLSSGAALGNACGPLLVARQSLTEDEILQGPIALPGTWTTAHLLFSIFYPKAADKRFYPFHEIEQQVVKGQVVGGVIIHENRFTYASKGLVKIVDLGQAWEDKTGLPIPLGGIFASRRLPTTIANKVEALIRESILFARENEDVVMDYVRQFSQEMDEEVMKQHIGLYVNDFSLDLGEKGRNAIKALKKVSA